MTVSDAHRGLRRRRARTALVGGLVLAVLMQITAIAAGPIASSTFTGTEDPLSESGTWVALTSLSPTGGRFQKNNGAFPDKPGPDHAGARTTAAVPADHYSEIVVGHVGTSTNNVGPIVRVQTSGPTVDSHYLWWASQPSGVNGLYRIDANGTSYTANLIFITPGVIDGDRLRLIARGPVIYGLKNGTREFIYNTGPDTTRYAGGTTGILGWAGDGVMTNSTIASWSTDAVSTSTASWASSNFIGFEDPLDEGDRWYPLPGYSGFRKTGGLATGKDGNHNASGVWSIAPSARQYSEVTLGTVASGGGGPIVRIDRNNPGQTGWLLFLSLDNPTVSGIYKMIPDGTMSPARLFTPAIISGDRWRLAADGNALEVFQNGVSQLTYTTDGAYAGGDVGIEAYTPAFTFAGWEGGTSPTAVPDTTPPTAPAALTAVASVGGRVDLAWGPARDDVGVTGYLVERCQGAGCTTFVQIATTSGTTYTDTGLAANTSYSYRVRAQDAAGNRSPYSNEATATALAL
jgi:hypothetical protein